MARRTLPLKAGLILHQLQIEAAIERQTAALDKDDDSTKPPEANPMHSPQSRRTSGVAL